MTTEYSRALRLASGVSDATEQSLLDRLVQLEVGVSIDTSRLGHVDTAGLLLETIGRLPVALALDPRGLSDDETKALDDAVTALRPTKRLRIGDLTASDVTVHVGTDHRDADVLTVPVRHGARVGRARHLAGGPPPSGLGVMTASALGSAEVFKLAARVLPSRSVAHEALSWCPVALSNRPEATPALGDPLSIDVAVVGVGAIGTAVARTLSLLAAEGRIQLVDPERFGPENLATYSLGLFADADRRPWKVHLGADALSTATCEQYAMPVEEFIERIDAGTIRWPRVVLSGLDSVHARREVQRIWPDRLIDGATGDTTCGLHDVRAEHGACLQCLFPVRVDGPSAAERLSDITGLPTDVLRYGDQLLAESHLVGRSPAQRALLEPHVGKPICGLGPAIGLSALPGDDYRPSISFVSQQAACLVVGRLLADLLNISRVPTFVQYDALIGPQTMTAEDRHADPACMCQQRSALVARVRAERRHDPPAS